MDYRQPCPHCGATLDWIWRQVQQSFLIVCRTCHCHFTLTGDLIKWGARCPRLTGKKVGAR